MGWPRGKPRKQKTESLTPIQQAAAKADPRHKMKARPNWDDYVAEEAPENELHIPADSFPDDMDLQWVAISCLGEPLNDQRSMYEQKGWTPIHQSDFDGLYDGRWMRKGEEGEITYKGLVLMARPLKYSKRAKELEFKKAREQVMVKEAALKGGDLPTSLDSQHPSALRSNIINKTIERIEVPKE